MFIYLCKYIWKQILIIILKTNLIYCLKIHDFFAKQILDYQFIVGKSRFLLGFQIFEPTSYHYCRPSL